MTCDTKKTLKKVDFSFPTDFFSLICTASIQKLSLDAFLKFELLRKEMSFKAVLPK